MTEQIKVILHAEDEPAHAAIVRMAIQRNIANIELRQVDNGKAALDYLWRREDYQEPFTSPRPDLTLLDLRMPLVSGFDVVAAVKKDLELQTIPVVVLTTSDVEEDQTRTRDAGTDGYLTKPVDFAKFVEMVKNVCSTWL